MNHVDERIHRRPAGSTIGWFARHLPVHRRRRHAEEERQLCITAVVTRSEVTGAPVPADVDAWSAEASLAWLQEHRNDLPAV